MKYQLKITQRDIRKRYADAFETGKPPPDTGGLSEFGVGMKIAACWFADKWKVHAKHWEKKIGDW